MIKLRNGKMKYLIILISLVVSINCFASQVNEKEAVGGAPVKLFANLPHKFDASDPQHKKQLIEAHVELFNAYKTGKKVNHVIGTLLYCPDLATKLYSKDRSSLYLVIKNAKRGGDTDHVFSKLDNRIVMLRYLIQSIKECGCKIDDVVDLNELLSIACSHGHRDMVAMLLDEGADVNYVDETGCHTMHHATLNYGHSTDMIKLLLARGADLNPLGSPKMTPMNLILARNDAYYDRENTIALLQELGAKYASQLLDEANSE